MSDDVLVLKARDILSGFSLAGKTAVVTGGAKGLGRACSLALAGAGANVIIAGKTEANNKKTAAEVAELGVKTGDILFDVRDEEQVRDMVKAAKEMFGGIDILINSAGIADVQPIAEFDTELWQNIMDVNVRGTFLCSREFAKALLEQGRGGRIINISSLQGFLGRAGDAAYSSSKAAVNLMTKSMACEWAKDGICVNAIAPTWNWTEMTAPILKDEAFYEKLVNRIPAGRAGDVADLFGLVVYLASDTSAFLNGAIIPFDGGAYACDGFPGVI